MSRILHHDNEKEKPRNHYQKHARMMDIASDYIGTGDSSEHDQKEYDQYSFAKPEDFIFFRGNSSLYLNDFGHTGLADVRLACMKIADEVAEAHRIPRQAARNALNASTPRRCSRPRNIRPWRLST